jgi:hypothetical protein
VSQRHNEALEVIRREYDDVVSSLKGAAARNKRGAPGNPAFDPNALEIAVATATDAYALLMIATAESYLREFLLSRGISLLEPKLSILIDRAVKELNLSAGTTKIRPADKAAIHNLRESRNLYAHGHARHVFPSVAKLENTLGKFFGPFP